MQTSSLLIINSGNFLLLPVGSASVDIPSAGKQDSWRQLTYCRQCVVDCSRSDMFGLALHTQQDLAVADRDIGRTGLAWQ